MEGATSLISTVGFPIVCALALAWFVKYLIDKNHEQMEKITASHKEEMEKMTTAINNNTIALTRLIERMGGDLNVSEGPEIRN